MGGCSGGSGWEGGCGTCWGVGWKGMGGCVDRGLAWQRDNARKLATKLRRKLREKSGGKNARKTVRKPPKKTRNKTIHLFPAFFPHNSRAGDALKNGVNNALKNGVKRALLAAVRELAGHAFRPSQAQRLRICSPGVYMRG